MAGTRQTILLLISQYTKVCEFRSYSQVMVEAETDSRSTPRAALRVMCTTEGRNMWV